MAFKKGSKEEVRRKLVRGSVAAPLLVTLRPGTAAAASFSCFDKTPSTTTAAQFVETEGADTLVRVKRDIYRVQVQGPPAPGRIPGNHDAFQLGTNWVRQSDNVVVAPFGGTGVNPSASPIDSDYYLAYVDSTGQIVAVAPETQAADTKAVSLLCWNSIKTV